MKRRAAGFGHQAKSWHDPRAEPPGGAMGLARNIRVGLHRIGMTLAALPILIGLVGLVSQEETIYRTNAQLASAKQDAATLRRDDWTICERDVLTAARKVLTLVDFAATYDDKADGCHVTKSSDGYPLKYLNAIETLVIQRRTSAYELARAERGRYLQFGFGLAVLSLVIYGLCRLLGWILSGFAGE